ncbi:MucBP domain-containing protein [Latilactobacillus sp. 5-91]|uniref:MucBP domain-containing protein n=1 Tax=Latilactobacillus sp. 5-91 TaxID=3410924 RepID=UPI003C77664A
MKAYQTILLSSIVLSTLNTGTVLADTANQKTTTDQTEQTKAVANSSRVTSTSQSNGATTSSATSVSAVAPKTAVQQPTSQTISAKEVTPVATQQTQQSVSQTKATPTATQQAGSVVLTAANFPDAGLRKKVSQFDSDKDGVLSPTELTKITSLNLYNTGVKDITGIKLLTHLSNLDASFSELTKLDLRGMTSLTKLDYSESPNLTEIDIRECPNLISAFHSVKNETVYISAGMTQYIGCPYVDEHTGHIVIDLGGVAQTQPNGSKTVDLSRVISPDLLAVFKKHQQPGFDVNTNILTIPANQTSSTYIAGKDHMYKDTNWLFYTNYDKQALPVTAKYVDEQGQELAKSETFKGDLGEQYKTVQKDIAGYTLKEVQGQATGTYAKQAQTVTYVYVKKTAVVTEKGTVTAKYVDEKGQEIAKSEILSGKVGDQYTTNQKAIDGYTFKKVEGTTTGKYTKASQTVTYVYTKKAAVVTEKGTVTAKYVDEKGQEIAKSEILSGKVGDQYTTNQKAIDGYTFKKVEGTTTGKYTKASQTVTYVYTKKAAVVTEKGTVTAKYVDEKGQEIAKSEILSGKVGDQYTTNQKAIDGYTFKKVEGTTTGKYTKASQMVTYVYAKKTVVTETRPTTPNKPNNHVNKTPNINQQTTIKETGKKKLPQTGTNNVLGVTVAGLLLTAAAGFKLILGRKQN